MKTSNDWESALLSFDVIDRQTIQIDASANYFPKNDQLGLLGRRG